MNDELSYAEMLEIPVETVTVKRKEKKKKGREEALSDQLVEQVNERMQTGDPAYAESTTIEREAVKKPRPSWAKRVLVGELIAVVVLCAAIFFTNLFIPNSAINTFVRGLFRGASTADTRTYNDFALSPVVNGFDDVDITVSETGVMSFTAECSVYAPCAGALERVTGSAEEGYSVLLRHSDSFTTVISGLDTVYAAEGETVRTNTPLGFTDGDGVVRVMFYDNDRLITNYSLGENGLAWS